MGKEALLTMISFVRTKYILLEGQMSTPEEPGLFDYKVLLVDRGL